MVLEMEEDCEDFGGFYRRLFRGKHVVVQLGVDQLTRYDGEKKTRCPLS